MVDTPDAFRLALALVALILLLGTASALIHARRPRLAAALKMGAASAYVTLALVGGALASPYGRLLLAGLALCWVGDLLLIADGRGAAFLGGLAAFLLGHVAYAAAFGTAGVSVRWLAWAAGPVLLVGAAVLRWLWRRPLPPSMKAPVVAYVAAISVMVACAWGAAGSGAPASVPLGAVAFMASDVLVARQRFVTPSAWNARVGLPLYFLGQALLALSV